MWSSLRDKYLAGDIRALARCITLIESEAEGYVDFLESLPEAGHPLVLGITGPPGAGKSTLTDGLIGVLAEAGKRTAVLCIDPSSPFHHGAILGDRIRMCRWHDHPRVYIRSLSTRGSMGGLNPKMIEITEFLKSAGFDAILIETVGVGQSEVDISGLADITLVVMVPESGDDVQTMKAGLMEVADVFVVNKSDRPGADTLVSALRQMLAPAFQRQKEVPVLKTVASTGAGVPELMDVLQNLQRMPSEKRNWLLAEKAYQLIAARRMKDVSRDTLRERLGASSHRNIYRLLKEWGY